MFPIILYCILISLFSILFPFLAVPQERPFGVSLPRKHIRNKEIRRNKLFYVLFLASTDGLNLWFLVALHTHFQINTLTIVCILMFPVFAASFCYRVFRVRIIRLKLRNYWDEEPLEIAEKAAKPQLAASWFLIPLFLTAATWFLTALLYGKLPDTIPVEYAQSGAVAAELPKRFGTVFLYPLCQLAAMLPFALLARSSGKDKRAESSLWQAFFLYLCCLATGMFLAAQLSILQILEPAVSNACSLGGILCAMYGVLILFYRLKKS